MAESITVTVHLSRDLRECLTALAKSSGRDESDIVAEAITAYADVQRWQIDGIREAMRKADAGGPFVPHDEVEAWAKSLGTEDELPRPKARYLP